MKSKDVEVEQEFFVAEAVTFWEDCEPVDGKHFARKMINGTIGYMPVYQTLEEAERNNPGCAIRRKVVTEATPRKDAQ